MLEKTAKQYHSIQIRLEPELYTVFAALAQAERRSIANLAEMLVVQYIQERKLATPNSTAPVTPPTTTTQVATTPAIPGTVDKNRKRRKPIGS